MHYNAEGQQLCERSCLSILAHCPYWSWCSILSNEMRYQYTWDLYCTDIVVFKQILGWLYSGIILQPRNEDCKGLLLVWKDKRREVYKHIGSWRGKLSERSAIITIPSASKTWQPDWKLGLSVLAQALSAARYHPLFLEKLLHQVDSSADISPAQPENYLRSSLLRFTGATWPRTHGQGSHHTTTMQGYGMVVLSSRIIYLCQTLACRRRWSHTLCAPMASVTEVRGCQIARVVRVY